MLVVGSLLSGVDLKSIIDRDCFYYSFLRLAAIPAVVFGVLLLLKVDKLVTGVAVLSAAMPAATVTPMLAEKYGRDAKFASKMLFVSTALSLVTLPIVGKILTTVLNVSV
jgi:predicted permease